MSIINKKTEIERLIKAFELEADKYHDIEFHTYLLLQEGKSEMDRNFRQPCHVIMLWQYIGQLGKEDVLNKFINNLNKSDFKWGIRGAPLTKFGVIEGSATNLFLRMAKRAGALFNDEEALTFKSRVLKEIQERDSKNSPKSLPTAAVNDNPLAVWLNYLLFYLSQTYPRRVISNRIEPDLFTLSLLALEQYADELTIEKSDRSGTQLSKICFKVALSFPGEKRRYVSRVADILRRELPNDSVFYDLDYQAQIARPNADILLQNIYHKQSELVVVFLCKDYSRKEWCGLEWRAIRDLIKLKNDDKIMFVNFDNAKIDGMFSIDGYMDGSKNKAESVANYILDRLKAIKK